MCRFIQKHLKVRQVVLNFYILGGDGGGVRVKVLVTLTRCERQNNGEKRERKGKKQSCGIRLDLKKVKIKRLHWGFREALISVLRKKLFF